MCYRFVISHILGFAGSLVRPLKCSCCITDLFIFLFCTGCAKPAFFHSKNKTGFRDRSEFIALVKKSSVSEVNEEENKGRKAHLKVGEWKTNCSRSMWITCWVGCGSSMGYKQQVGPMVVIIEGKNKQALVFQQFWLRNSTTATCISLQCYKSFATFLLMSTWGLKYNSDHSATRHLVLSQPLLNIFRAICANFGVWWKVHEYQCLVPFSVLLKFKIITFYHTACMKKEWLFHLIQSLRSHNPRSNVDPPIHVGGSGCQ